MFNYVGEIVPFCGKNMDATVRQANRPLIRSVTFAAALIGTLEALIWTSLSLISILFYHSIILIDENLPTNSYEHHDSESIADVIVTTKTFNIFMYIYLVLSLIWLITSLNALWAMTRNKWADGFSIVGGWALVTLMISVLDIVLMSVVVADFVTVQGFYTSSEATTSTTVTTTATSISASTADTYTTISVTTPVSAGPTGTEATTVSSDYFSQDTTTIAPSPPGFALVVASWILETAEYEGLKEVIYTSYGIVMSLAARGYVLWIVNVIFACILMKFAYDLKKEAAPSLLPILDAYSTGSHRTPWNLYEQTDISNAYSNDAFKDENDQSMFRRSDSFISQDPSAKGRNPPQQRRQPLQSGDTQQEPHTSPQSQCRKRQGGKDWKEKRTQDAPRRTSRLYAPWESPDAAQVCFKAEEQLRFVKKVDMTAANLFFLRGILLLWLVCAVVCVHNKRDVHRIVIKERRPRSQKKGHGHYHGHSRNVSQKSKGRKKHKDSSEESRSFEDSEESSSASSSESSFEDKYRSYNTQKPYHQHNNNHRPHKSKTTHKKPSHFSSHEHEATKDYRDKNGPTYHSEWIPLSSEHVQVFSSRERPTNNRKKRKESKHGKQFFETYPQHNTNIGGFFNYPNWNYQQKLYESFPPLIGTIEQPKFEVLASPIGLQNQRTSYEATELLPSESIKTTLIRIPEESLVVSEEETKGGLKNETMETTTTVKPTTIRSRG
ncbi:hypothetical protein NQ317_019939, partial [Molorchus minor]